GFVASLDVVRIQLLIIQNHDRHAALVILGGIRFEVSCGDEYRRLQPQPVQRILRRASARDSQSQASLGKGVALKKLRNDITQGLILVWQRDEQHITGPTKPLKMLLKTKDTTVPSAHGSKEACSMEQPRIMERNAGGRVLDKAIVNPRN